MPDSATPEMKNQIRLLAWARKQEATGLTGDLLLYAVYMQGAIDALRDETKRKEREGGR